MISIHIPPEFIDRFEISRMVEAGEGVVACVTSRVTATKFACYIPFGAHQPRPQVKLNTWLKTFALNRDQERLAELRGFPRKSKK